MYRLTDRMIKDRCGDQSYKKGQEYVRRNRVHILTKRDEHVSATVKGDEDFSVTINLSDNRASCSCPKLASFKKECQHIAAVWLALKDEAAADGLIALFNEEKSVPTVKAHFETRDVLHLHWLLRYEETMYLYLTIEGREILDIHGFTEAVKEGKRYRISNDFDYLPSSHCLQLEDMQLLDCLEHSREGHPDTGSLIISPSAWRGIQPLLTYVKASFEYPTGERTGFTVSKDMPDIGFHFDHTEQGFTLHIKGVRDLQVIPPYELVMDDGIFRTLSAPNGRKLIEMKKLLTSSSDVIRIPHTQINLFVEKVAVGLKDLGEVTFSETMMTLITHTPLEAKLYLDRVGNRLLAGLEFQYGHLSINPLAPVQDDGQFLRDRVQEQRILEKIDQIPFTRTEEGLYLQNEELEFDFLTYGVNDLKGYMNIFATTAVRNRLYKRKALPRLRVKVNKERGNWLHFSFDMNGIPQKQIEGILQALEEKRTYYPMGDGSLLSLKTKEIRDMEKFLHTVEADRHDLLNGMGVAVSPTSELLDIVEDSDLYHLDESYAEFIKGIHHPETLHYPVPQELKGVLMPYQETGYSWLKYLASFRFGGLLADDMGLGKTLQAIAYILSEKAEINDPEDPILVVCPSSVVHNWQRELEKFAPVLRVRVIEGTSTKRKNLMLDTGADVWITSYPLIRMDYRQYENVKFHTVFLDEAQAFKNPYTQTSRAVKKIRSKRIFAMTGTPIENTLEELWSIFHVISPGVLGGITDFSHLQPKEASRKVRPFILRRVKKDVLTQLPEKHESVEMIDLLPEQKALYASYLAKLKHDEWKHLDRHTLDKNRIKILAGLTRLRQLCCHPALFVEGYQGGSAKLLHLLALIKDAKSEGRRVLIFSQFTSMLKIIGGELLKQGTPYFYLSGETDSLERVDLCRRFNEGERDFFLISLKAGGTGLNLQGADTVILYDTWWNPAVENQATDRAHRMGQTKEVQVIKLLSKGTIEAKMNELQLKKKALYHEVIDQDYHWSVEDLKILMEE
ncbi:DEAD/DEAH box helicase [Rossellomorea marisflavi]|uniref:DEAD/DEAH box helicase n=1 Tax=Rossellomorea marisflavi TaxID=189381 RepID=UPI00203A8BF8|nr:DEAD/DEAH box helicase [Rossellomorea marisflavi]MCM2604432.1 DEAD/DEAH box helicase [Rossellomorea marisflavi]